MRPLPRWLARSVVAAAAAIAAAATQGATANATPVPLAVGSTVMSAITGPPRAALIARVRAGQVGGIILLGNGWRSSAEMAAATGSLERAACADVGRPLLVATDQEGGPTRRLRWAPPWDSEAALGRSASTARVESEAAGAAAALRRAGIDIDLAPVADTLLTPASFLGDRSFGSSPSLVAALTASYVDGLQGAGIAATAKHFPGLGAAKVNTDDAAVSLLRVQLAPFRRAIAADVQLVMMSNASYPHLDPSGTPAVFSSPIVTGLLRGTLGFQGVVVTDALDAPTPAATPHAAARAIRAGVDLLLYTTDRTAQFGYTSLLADARADPGLRTQITAAVTRLDALESWLGLSC